MELALFEKEEDFSRMGHFLYYEGHKHGVELSWNYWTGLKSDGSQIITQRRNQPLNANQTTAAYQKITDWNMGGLAFTADGYYQSELRFHMENNLFYFLCEELPETENEGMTKNIRLGYCSGIFSAPYNPNF